MRKLFLTFALALLAMAIPSLALAQYEGQFYVMHASGLHLAKSTSSAILESADAANPQMLTIAKTSDGYYTFKAPDGTYLAQNGSNEWNTGFIANANGDVAKFSIEKSDQFIKIKNKRTGKYLGVDEVKDGNWVFCDKSGTSTTHMWFLSDDVHAAVPGNEYFVVVNPAATRQEFKGFGVSLCWWAHMCGSWDDNKIDQIVEWLVSPEYLNYKYFRYNIGGGDDPEHRNCTEHHMGASGGKGIRAEIPGYKEYETSEYDWDADAAQVKIMVKIKEKRPDAVFEAFSNSAPWWMTYSGCCSGANSGSSDNLKPEYYEAFCHYLVDVCKHIKDEYGIEFKTLEPFNEPMSNWWGRNGGQEGCHFSVNSQIAVIKALYPILQESGLNTVISVSDENDISQQVKDFTQFANADVLKYVGQVNAHTYNGNVNACSNLSAQCHNAGLPLWMSEVGASGDGIQGNLNMAKHLIRDMRYMEPEVWCDWQYIEEGYDQWCLVQAGFKSQNYQRVNNFYVRQHISKYIVPGSTILTSTNDNTLAAKTPDGENIVIVVVNPEALESSYRIDLGMFSDLKQPTVAAWSTSKSYFNDLSYKLADSYLSFRMPGLSIATFVVPVTEDENLAEEIVSGGKYLIMPRNNNGVAITAADGKVSLQQADFSPEQIWTVKGDMSKATFTNGNGVSIFGNDSYNLATTDGAGTEFEIAHIGQNYYKISLGSRAFDLEGEKSTVSTGIGLWDYGTSPAASHRQFRFHQIVDRNNITPELGGIFDAIGANSTKATFKTAKGIVSIEGMEGGRIMICTLDGKVAYSATVESGSIDVPMPAGVYVASYINGAVIDSRIVNVK